MLFLFTVVILVAPNLNIFVLLHFLFRWPIVAHWLLVGLFEDFSAARLLLDSLVRRAAVLVFVSLLLLSHLLAVLDEGFTRGGDGMLLWQPRLNVLRSPVVLRRQGRRGNFCRGFGLSEAE